MAGLLKKTTGLVGLAVSHNPHEQLRILYTKILACVEKMPQEAAYRKYTEQLITERFEHVKMEPDIEKLEKKMNCGQIEEGHFTGRTGAVSIQEDDGVETMGTTD
ncbi:hypothetical protein SKAU_G00042450 [Synaphobranchus kaupii]|uniref:NADH dehydrogenase [ubiquinone] 1 alpha subcomplex subunit 5 n=1 Tax=Synaphobranchus kaupii TaxID=118154 RepID=A0A9Q1J8Y3_SYNKA|nr:hypothetical protein SKAU_G00042450 [Synaphobranchus kaupii]